MRSSRGRKLSTPTQNILIVEDDVQLRLLLSAILAQAGYKVRTTEDGFSALAEIRTEAPDILLSDLYMSGMSGFELLSVVRRRFPAIQVIAMSSAFSGSDVPTGIAADAFYEKATNVAGLLQIIEATIHFDGLYSIYRPGPSAPIWIDAPSGEPYVMMACPECLRMFTQVLGKTGCLIRESCCVYCHSLIHYAIVQPTNQTSSRAFQWKPILEIPLMRLTTVSADQRWCTPHVGRTQEDAL